MEEFLENSERNLIRLLRMLISQNRYFPISEIAAELGVSRNTALRDLDRLLQYIPSEYLKYEPVKGACLTTDNVALLENARIKILKNSFFYNLLFQTALRIVTSSEALQQKFFISRSVAYQKIQRINKVLESYHLYMNPTTLQLSGNEAQIRTFYQYMFYQVNVKLDDKDQLDIIYNVSQMVDGTHKIVGQMSKEDQVIHTAKTQAKMKLFIDGLEHLVDVLCRHSHFTLSKNQCEEYYYGIFIACTRIKFGHPIDPPTIKDLSAFQPHFAALTDVFTSLEDTFQLTLNDHERLYILLLGKVYSGSYTSLKTTQIQIAFYQDNYIRLYNKAEKLHLLIVENEQLSPALSTRILASLLDMLSLLWTFEYLPEKLMFHSSYTPYDDSQRTNAVMRQVKKSNNAISEDNLNIIQRFINNIFRLIDAHKTISDQIQIRVELRDGFYEESYLRKRLQTIFESKIKVIISSENPDADITYDLLVTDLAGLLESDRPTIYWASDNADCFNRLVTQINILLGMII